MVYITTFLGVSTTLFLIGVLGIVLNRKNILIRTISKISNLHKDSFELVKLKYFPRTSNNKISYNELNKKYVKL